MRDKLSVNKSLSENCLPKHKRQRVLKSEINSYVVVLSRIRVIYDATVKIRNKFEINSES